jgi:hypothetical protein
MLVVSSARAVPKMLLSLVLKDPPSASAQFVASIADSPGCENDYVPPARRFYGALGRAAVREQWIKIGSVTLRGSRVRLASRDLSGGGTETRL